MRSRFANTNYIFSYNKMPWKFFIVIDVIRGIVKQLSELIVFWWSVKKAFDLNPAVYPEISI